MFLIWSLKFSVILSESDAYLSTQKPSMNILLESERLLGNVSFPFFILECLELIVTGFRLVKRALQDVNNVFN